MDCLYPSNYGLLEEARGTDPARSLHAAAEPLRPLLNNHRGFTMIEIIVVLMLLGIVGAMAAARFGGVAEAAVRAGASQKVMAHLRYVQALAMGDQGHMYYIVFSGNSYSMHKNDMLTGGAVTSPILPGESSSVVILDEGVSVASTIVGFNQYGYARTTTPGVDFQNFNTTYCPMFEIELIGCDTSIMVTYAGKICLSNS